MSITITTIPNPFEPEINTIQEKEFYSDQPLSFYIQDIVIPREDVSFVVSVNGTVIENFNYIVQDNDKISIVAKTEASMVASYVAGTVAGSLWGSGVFIGNFATAMALGFGTALTYGLAYIATYFVISYGMNLLASALAPDTPDAGRINQDTQTEPTYSWLMLQNTTTENTAIPLIFGTNKVAGQVINKFVTISGDKETLNVLLGVCDHELDSITDVKINGQNYTNYHDVTVVTDRLGTNSDTVIPGFDEVVSQIDVNSKLDYNTPLSQTTSGNTVEKIKIIIHAPRGLYYTNNSGGLDSRSATFDIHYRATGAGSWTLSSQETMSGSTTEPQREIYTISGLSPDQYDVQITRTNQEESSYRGSSDIFFAAIQEIVDETLIYPGLAKYAVQALATEQLSGGMPDFSCLATRNYVSVFDRELGTPAWADKRATNPAWICYYLLVWGAKIDESRLIWSDWNNWAVYCDENVDGSERFILSSVIQSGNFWEKIQEIAKLGRASIIRRGTRYGVFVDKATATVSHLFTMGNILKDTLKINYLPGKDRANAVEIEYTDSERDYTRQVLCVYSDDYLEDETNGQKSTLKINGACTKDQVIREGVYRINSNKYLVKTVSFEAYVDSFACTIGDLFYFQHEFSNAEIFDYLTDKNGVTILDESGDAIWSELYKNNFSGRIVDAGNDDGSGNPYVQLDQEMTIEAAKSYKVLVRLTDDSLIEKTINNAAGTTDILTLTSSWTDVPEKYDIFLVGVVGSYKKTYRLTHITRKDDFTCEIVGIEYVPEIYTENDSYVIENPTWTTRKPKALNVILTEFISYKKDGSYLSNINISWHRGYTQTGSNWSVWIEDSTAGTSPKKIGDAFTTSFVYNKDLVVGNTYKVYVVAINEGATDTGDNTNTITIQGQLAPPADVTNFAAAWDVIKRQVSFSWTKNNEIDMDHYEIRQGGTWSTATKIFETKDNYGVTYIDEGVTESRTYSIKAIDTSGVESTNAVTDSVSIDTDEVDMAVPGSLNITSSSNIGDDGTDHVMLQITWDTSSESSDNFHHYEVQLEQTGISKVSEFACSSNQFQIAVLPNTQYGVTVRAVDVSGNKTSWVSQELHTTTKDAAAPNAPTSLSASGTFTNIILTWSHSAEADLDHFTVFRNSSNDSGTASQIGAAVKEFSGTLAQFSDTPPDNSTYYYWVKAVDTSNNSSSFSAVDSASAPGAAGSIGAGEITETEIADDAVTSPKITANAVIAAKINAGAVGVDKLAANAVTAAKINVATLDAITAAIGTLTSGRIQNAGNTTYLDLTNDLMALGAGLTWNGTTLSVSGDITVGNPTSVRGDINVADGADVTADNETFSQESDINVLNTTNAPAEGGATDNSSWEHASDTTKIDGGEIYVGSEIQIGSSGGTDDYCIMNAGDISFYRYINSAHRLAKSLKKVNSGTASNGDTVTIPGYFSSTPKVIVSASDISIYDPSYPNAEQGLQCRIENLSGTNGSYSFDVVSQLVLTGIFNSTTVNETESWSDESSTKSTTTQTTGSNVVEVTVNGTWSIRCERTIMGAKTCSYSTEDRAGSVEIWVNVDSTDYKVVDESTMGQESGSFSKTVSFGSQAARDIFCKGTIDCTVTPDDVCDIWATADMTFTTYTDLSDNTVAAEGTLNWISVGD